MASSYSGQRVGGGVGAVEPVGERPHAQRLERGQLVAPRLLDEGALRR